MKSSKARQLKALATGVAFANALVACGGGGGNGTSANDGAATATYTIGGSVTGLATGTQVKLQDNGADTLTISANGAFTFSAPVAANSSYAVTVSGQPAGQICSITGSSGSGTAVSANVGNVGISCTSQSSASNALDRINFGDAGTDAFSESAHAFVNLGQPLGVGAQGLTYRRIAPSSVPANVGNADDNEVLTFTMACSPTLQNYLTIQVWGSDTDSDFIYLYTPEQGNVLGNYLGLNQPELDNQGSQPTQPGVFVYETVPIPLSMTSGHTSVTLTLNAGQTSGAELPSGSRTRPIYSAFTHTNPYLIVASDDPQGTAPAGAAPKAAVYNSAYFASILSQIANYVSDIEVNQLYGSSWTAAVNAGTVPPQIIGSFATGLSPSRTFTKAQWLNNAATTTAASNNVAMQRLEMLSFAYSTPDFLTTYYHDSGTEQRIVAALDSFSYMQALNGCFGEMAEWDGVGATTPTSSNPYGRLNARCSPIEGQGTWALGAAIVEMQNDPAFLAALNQPISSTLEPGVMRYKAYQTMLVNHLNFLIPGHGHAPNQDLLQAKAYVYANLALRVLDKIYATNLARSNAQMYDDYLNETTGIVPNGIPDLWISKGGLGLEVNGSLNGSYDGSYGWVDVGYLSWLAKILKDNGIETEASHPVRTVALNASYAFSNFLYPGLMPAGTGNGYQTTMLQEQFLTYRWDANVGPVNTLPVYFNAAEFNDPYAIHGFYLEHANGITWPYLPPGDDAAEGYMHWYGDYVKLCNMLNAQPNDPSGVTFLNEAAHPDGVWSDPTGSTLSIKHAGESLEMVLNWRPLKTPGNVTGPNPSNPIVDNVARVHDTTGTMVRLATIKMPSSAATGASGSYTSGASGTLYVGRYGNYLVALNQQSSVATMTLPPDMTLGTATDLASGTSYDLTKTKSVAVPALGSVVLYQSVPTWAAK